MLLEHTFDEHREICRYNMDSVNREIFQCKIMSQFVAKHVHNSIAKGYKYFQH